MIIIDAEFKSLIPPLKPEEKEALRRSLKIDGCRDALKIWRVNSENAILLDGHNRYEICAECGIAFEISRIELADRSAALEWIIRNQLARRNLTPYEYGVLALRLKDEIAARAKARQGNDGKPSKEIHNDSLRATLPQVILDEKRIKTRDELAKISGLSPRTIDKIYVIQEHAPEPVKEKLRAGETTINGEYQKIKREIREKKREDRRKENAEKADSATDILSIGAKFSAIMVDPPWDWGDEGDINQLGRAKPDYGTIPFCELLDLPIADLSDEDCHLYLWITNRSLPKGFALLEKWGFRYITCLTWVKPSFGMGNYFRGQTEQILFGVKGSQMLKRKDASTVFFANRGDGGHSSKPKEIYEFIESCSPGPYLEIFSRSKKTGWAHWGADA